MAITISGQNNNDKILASDGVLDSISGFNVVGVLTTGSLDVTNFDANHINIGSNIQLGNAGIITATTLIGNVTGNVNSTSNLLLQISGSEKFRVGNGGQLGIGGANYGTSGQVLTSGGSGSAPTWSTIASDKITEGNTEAEVVDTGSDGHFKVTTEGSERFRIDSNGKVQIATNNNTGSNAKLVVGSGSSTADAITVINTNDQDVDVIRLSNFDGATTSNKLEVHFDSSGHAGFDVGIPATTPVFEIRNTSGGGGRFRLKNDGKLLINTTTEGFAEADDLTINSADHGGITIRTPTNKEGNIAFSDTTSGTGEYSGLIRYRHSQNDLGLWTSSNLRLLIDSVGNMSLGKGAASSTNYGANFQIHDTGTSGAALHLSNSNTGSSNSDGFHLVQQGNHIYHWNRESGDQVFATAANERLRIHSDYLVTVGYNDISSTTQPSKLRVQGSYVNAVGPFGILEFKNRDNSGNAVCSIRGVRDGIQGGNYSAGLTFHTNGLNPASASDGDYERLRITSDGNIIIGHTSGSNKLQIGNTGHSGYCIAANSPSYGAVIQVGDGATPGTAAALWIRNLNNGGGTTACFRVQGDGTAHFGDQTSTGKYNDGNTGASWYDAKDSWQQGQSGTLGWSMWYLNKIGGTSTDNRMIQFNNSGSAIGYIQRSGSNIVYQTSSDYRLKKDVVALPNSIERVKQLRPVAFKWIEDNSDMEGFLAHEAQEICPYAVSGTKDEVALEDHGDRKKGDMIVQAIDYGEFTPLLTAAMKELITKVETLEAKVAALEGS